MKIDKETLNQIIKEELEAVQQEGFMDYMKNMVGIKTPKPAMKAFNQGPSGYNFKLVDELELGERKRTFLRSLGQTRVAIGSSRKSGRGTVENYFFGPDVKSGMIDTQKIKDDIASDLAGIDAMGYTHAPAGNLFFPRPIENPSDMPDYVGNPMRGWKMIAKYLSGKISRLPVKNKDLFAVQQAYAATQLE